MPRIRIDLPEHFNFVTEISVLIGHVNYGNHLDNALLLSLVSEARVRFLKAMGYTEMDIEGTGIIVADAAIQYQSEAFHGDLLQFEMAAVEFNKYGCDLVYRVREKTSLRNVACGKTGIVFFDYSRRKPVAVPQTFIEQSAKVFS